MGLNRITKTSSFVSECASRLFDSHDASASLPVMQSQAVYGRRRRGEDLLLPTILSSVMMVRQASGLPGPRFPETEWHRQEVCDPVPRLPTIICRQPPPASPAERLSPSPPPPLSPLPPLHLPDCVLTLMLLCCAGTEREREKAASLTFIPRHRMYI